MTALLAVLVAVVAFLLLAVFGQLVRIFDRLMKIEQEQRQVRAVLLTHAATLAGLATATGRVADSATGSLATMSGAMQQVITFLRTVRATEDGVVAASAVKH